MNQSFWERTSFFKEVDYTVIGAGIVGLFAALHIKNKVPQANVLVIERSVIPDGASTKNAGFACFGSLSELIVQLEKSDEQTLYDLVKKRWNGLNKLRRELGDDAIDFYQYGGYELFNTQQKELWEKCLSKQNYFNELLKDIIQAEEDIYQIKDDKIKEFGFKNVDHLIFNPYEAQIHSGKMMQALINKCKSVGINFLFGAEVKKIEEQSVQLDIGTESINLPTKKIIVCTNAYAKDLLPSVDLEPGRGQVFITKPISNLKIKGTFHYDEGYYYFRNIDDRILIGGGRNINFEKEKTKEFGITAEVKNKITELLNEVILPNINWEYEMEWSGIMAFGKELSPIVQQVSPSIYCAVRCNGMGVAIGSIVGEEVAKLCIMY